MADRCCLSLLAHASCYTAFDQFRCLQVLVLLAVVYLTWCLVSGFITCLVKTWHGILSIHVGIMTIWSLVCLIQSTASSALSICFFKTWRGFTLILFSAGCWCVGVIPAMVNTLTRHKAQLSEAQANIRHLTEERNALAADVQVVSRARYGQDWPCIYLTR